MRALAVACKSTSNPHAEACWKQRLRRMSALSAVSSFVCHSGGKRIASVCVISEMERQPHLGTI